MQDPAKKPLKKVMSTYFLSVHVAVTANFNTLLVLYICVIQFCRYVGVFGAENVSKFGYLVWLCIMTIVFAK